MQETFVRSGTPEKVPLLEEGRERGVIAEVYYMHHLPSAKGYVGLAYHGTHDRMKTHWNGGNREKVPCSTMMSNSVSPFEWIAWPLERFPGRRQGHVLFHKRAAVREGWWANKLQTWWPQGFNVAGTGGEHKGGARNDWWRYRETYHKVWRNEMQGRLQEGKARVVEICRRLQAGDEMVWTDLDKIPLDLQRQMLQALNVEVQLGGKWRHKLEHQMREHLRQHKIVKKMPDGDFVKLLLTHQGWNASDVRSIIREPEVCKLHPDPTAAERIWVCERNVAPIGSWLLNYTAMEDQDLTPTEVGALEEWEEGEGNKAPEEQWKDVRCHCHETIVFPEFEDVWKGHVCTSDVRKFKSPLVRALLVKGHAFKSEKSEETLLQEIRVGLDGYIKYKTKRTEDPAQYEPWKQAILSRVQGKLGKGDCTLYPSGAWVERKWQSCKGTLCS